MYVALLRRRGRLTRATENAADAELSLPGAPADPQRPSCGLCLLEEGLDDPHQPCPQEGEQVQRRKIQIYMLEQLCPYCLCGWTILAQHLTVEDSNYVVVLAAQLTGCVESKLYQGHTFVMQDPNNGRKHLKK